MQDKIRLLKEENDSIQSKLVKCESGYQGVIIAKNELDSCRGELTDEQNSKQQVYQDLQSAKRNIKTLEGDKKVLQNQLNSEKAESDRLRDQIRKLENDNQGLNNQNRNLYQSLQSARSNIKTLNNEKEVLENQLNSEKAENDNLQNSLAKVISEFSSCQSGNQWNQLSSRIQQLENLLADLDIDLWHQNFVNGEYVIAYEFNYGLNSEIKSMLPKVRP